MQTLREWRQQAQEGVLAEEYVEHLLARRRALGTASARRRWQQRATGLNRRAKRVGAEGRVRAEELMHLVLSYGSRCAYCGCHLDFTGEQLGLAEPPARRGTIDHVKPLSRGGRGDSGNLAPACSPCNQERSRWPDSALGVPAPHRFQLDGL
jgi:5-methylcytosine-specific restriction endonuclease McrA